MNEESTTSKGLSRPWLVAIVVGGAFVLMAVSSSKQGRSPDVVREPAPKFVAEPKKPRVIRKWNAFYSANPDEGWAIDPPDELHPYGPYPDPTRATRSMTYGQLRDNAVTRGKSMTRPSSNNGCPFSH